MDTGVNMPEDQIETPSTASDLDRRRWRDQFLVTAAVGVFVPLISGFTWYMWRDTPAYAVAPQFLSSAASSAAIIAVAWFVIRHSGEPASAFGIQRPIWGLDIAICVGALICGWMIQYTYALAAYSIAPSWAAGVSYDFQYPETAAENLIVSVAMVLNGLAEEIVLWAVLFTRLERLMSRTVVPVIVVAAMFASYHIYQGVSAVLSIFLLGLVHGTIFATGRRLLPLVAAHVIWDLWLMVIMPPAA